MKQSKTKWLAILALALSVCLLLAGCNETPTPEPDEHTHTYDTSKWIIDDANHWHAASCEHSDEKIDVSEHIDDDENEICDVCEYVLHKHAYNMDEWATDDGAHWHASTCGCEDEKADFALHTDAELDALCDVCGFKIHYHLYDTEHWTSDETGHWHAATCEHDEKADFAGHTNDFLGSCTTCGYNDAKSIVGVAINLGTAAKSHVKQGMINGGNITYEFRNGYLYVHSASELGYKDTYTALDKNGNVFAVIYENNGGSYTETRRDANATELNILGPSIPTAFINNDFSYYGAEDLLTGLHSLAFTDNTNRDYTESYEDGIFSFTFGYYSDNYGLYVITTSFILDEATNAVLNVTVSTNLYSNHEDNYSIVKLTEANPEENIPETWGILEGASPAVTYTVSIEQSTTPSENHDTPNPYDPAKFCITDYDLATPDGEIVTDTIYITPRAELILNIVNTTPENPIMSFSPVVITGEGINAEFDFDDLEPWRQSLQISHMDPEQTFIKLTIFDGKGKTFTFNLSINGVVKTYTVIVNS